jgi:hypothetical protein
MFHPIPSITLTQTVLNHSSNRPVHTQQNLFIIFSLSLLASISTTRAVTKQAQHMHEQQQTQERKETMSTELTLLLPNVSVLCKDRFRCSSDKKQTFFLVHKCCLTNISNDSYWSNRTRAALAPASRDSLRATVVRNESTSRIQANTSSSPS